MQAHRLLLVLSGLASVAAAAGLWFLFAPTQLGGRVEYAVVQGASMEPTLHHGDLVVLRRRSHYRIGEIVGYRNADLHRVVLHRIEAVRGNRYLFKGDNNDFVDSARPTASALVGRLWLHVPAVGSVLARLHQPRNAAIAGGTLLLLLLAGGGTGTGFRRRRSRRRRERRRPAGPVRGHAWAVVGAGVAGAGLFGAVAALALVHPRTHVISDPSAYVEHGAYGYAATAPADAVYPSGRVRTGDTVFTSLVRRLTVDFRFRFDSPLPHAVRATGTLVARLRSQEGLERTLPLAPPARFAGDRWRAAGTLELGALRRTIAAYERATGVQVDSYTVEVVPRIALRGVVDGQPLATRFSPPPLSFGLSATSLQPATPNGDASAPFHVTTAGAIARTLPAPLVLGPLRLPLATARTAGVLGAAAFALVALLGLAFVARGGRRDELDEIRRRYDGWLVEIASPLAAPTIVDLTTMASLGRLAEHHDAPILHREHRGEHTFAVEAGGILYRFRLGDEERHLEPVVHDAPTLAVARVRRR